MLIVACAVCDIGGYEMANIKRDSAGHFAPGVSANPGGKAKVPDEIKTALRAASPKSTTPERWKERKLHC